MCGIAGYWKATSLADNAKDTLKNMTETLYHRGPDGYGFHIDKEEGLAMGHARLSIIDMETGRQPLYGQSKNQVLTVNGEFYDYKRIRTNLRLEGFSFTTKSDSEIALPLYKKHGLDFINQLRGEFAVALYDKERQQLVLARDRFGIKPLFYHISDKGVYYGSEVKSLFANPEVPGAFDAKALIHQLMHTMVPGTSAYKGIHAIKPGHMIIISKKGDSFDVKERKYWDMDFPEDSQREDKGEAFYVKQVQEKLMEAVSFRLEADVPVGCYLSGGIDSCSMLGLASSIQQSPVKAFTISFDNKDYDEAAIAKEMADRTKADQEQINLTASELYGDNYVKTLWHAERTFYNTLGVAKYCMSKRVNECGYRVVVTGEGSDELFGGYPFFKKDMFLHVYPEHEVEALRKQMEASNSLFKGAILAENPRRHQAMEDIVGFTPSWIQPWMHTLELASPLLSDDVLHETEGYDPIAAIAETFDSKQLKGRHVLDKVQYTWIKTMLEGQILNWGGDRVDMANSMESRPAFLDHHVAEAARNIPPHYRVKGNIEKYVLREAMKNILPEVLYKREKFAFMAPPGHTEKKKQNALQNLVDQFLNEDIVREAGLLDAQRVTKFLKDYNEDKDPVSLIRKDALLNHLIGVHVLHSHFIAGRKESLASLA
ncbi:asparagine synthase (glutamine-hydrolyzing) [Cytophagaceae bacterium ABcell3]|nr:asparagine synthase (glutamine-hydrolyzing) [Cytophagaceae bacterium ABcell3]